MQQREYKTRVNNLDGFRQRLIEVWSNTMLTQLLANDRKDCEPSCFHTHRRHFKHLLYTMSQKIVGHFYFYDNFGKRGLYF